MHGNIRNVVSINETVAVDVATRDITIEVGIALLKSSIVHIRGEVVLVYLTIEVDIARQNSLCTRHFEDIELTTRAEVANSFLHAHLHITCHWVGRERHFLRSTISSPLLWTDFCPVSTVFADSDIALRNRTVTAIRTWHILQFVKGVGAMEVDSEVEWHRLRIIIGVPDVASRTEVNESVDFETFHITGGRGCGKSLDSIL